MLFCDVASRLMVCIKRDGKKSIVYMTDKICLLFLRDERKIFLFDIFRSIATFLRSAGSMSDLLTFNR